jgi:hypothetical protein
MEKNTYHKALEMFGQVLALLASEMLSILHLLVQRLSTASSAGQPAPLLWWMKR